MARPNQRLLTRHVIRAALQVASVLGDGSTPLVVARESYWRRATGGVLSPADLVLGEDALVAAGVVTRHDDQLILTPMLGDLVHADHEDAVEALAVALLARQRPVDVTGQALVEGTVHELIDDPERRELLLMGLRRHWDDQHRQEIGDIGEELVVAQVRTELLSLGHPDLARRVRRVSLQSDQLGYDVVAPRIAGPPRLLEVKATTTTEVDQQYLYLSRAEADVGARFGDWALVVCAVYDVAARAGEILGWCQQTVLEKLLPVDAPGGRWQTAAIEIARIELEPGLPRVSW